MIDNVDRSCRQLEYLEIFLIDDKNGMHIENVTLFMCMRVYALRAMLYVEVIKKKIIIIITNIYELAWKIR